MELNSPNNSYLDPKNILEGQLRESFGRVVYSHKTHEKCADILLSRLSMIKLWQIILSALTTAGFVSVIFSDERLISLIGTGISVLLLALNTYAKDYNLGELAGKHKESANELWLIREKYISLLADLSIGNKPIETAQKRTRFSSNGIA